MTALALRLDPHPQSQAVNGRLDAIEEKLRKIPEYGLRIEMSRGFPVKPDELTAIGVKLEASEDAERLRELGLPTSTFLQEKFPMNVELGVVISSPNDHPQFYAWPGRRL